MVVLRCVPNISFANPGLTKAFYEDVFGLNVAMDMGWIITYASTEVSSATPQITVASSGGSNTPVPDISVEVDDVDGAYEKAKKCGAEIAYEITDEPWGVRRFYVNGLWLARRVARVAGLAVSDTMS